MSKRLLIRTMMFLSGTLLFLTACQSAQTSDSGGGMGMGLGMGDSGMMARHGAPIPEQFASLSNPVAADEASLARGKEIFTTNCVVCHGEGGMGDGPSAVNLDPAPAPIAHTSQMMSDAYLFWRVTEGGVPFETAMIPYGGVLDEQARWDVINYVRALGNGQTAGSGMNHMEAEAALRAEMLTQAIAQNILTQEEAAVFETVHSALDAAMSGGGHAMEMQGMGGGNQNMGGGTNMTSDINEILAGLVTAGALTQTQVDTFWDLHLRLEEAGLMK
jgi:mono/diheme cytochrome c family protein